MRVNPTRQEIAGAVPVTVEAKPLSELTAQQREEVSFELVRIQKLVSSLEEKTNHQNCGKRQA